MRRACGGAGEQGTAAVGPVVHRQSAHPVIRSGPRGPAGADGTEKDTHRDFCKVYKVDTHVHMAAGMTARQVRRPPAWPAGLIRGRLLQEFAKSCLLMGSAASVANVFARGGSRGKRRRWQAGCLQSMPL